MAERTVSREELIEGAKNGNAEYQFVLAHSLYYGKGFEKNEAEGIMWFEKATAQGHIDATYFLAAIYSNIENPYERADAVLPLYEKLAHSQQYNYIIDSAYYGALNCKLYAETSKYIHVGDKSINMINKGLEFINIAESFDVAKCNDDYLEKREKTIAMKTWFLFTGAMFNYIFTDDYKKANEYTSEDESGNIYISIVRELCNYELSQNNNDRSVILGKRMISILGNITSEVKDWYECIAAKLCLTHSSNYYSIVEDNALKAYKEILRVKALISANDVKNEIDEDLLSHYQYKDGIFGERCKYID